jgi:hypothetical protein
MSPTTKGPAPAAHPDLEQVSLNPPRYRSGRWFLLAEGIALAGVGLAGYIACIHNPAAGHGWGAPVLLLRLTPVHSAALLGFGVLAALATPTRRTTIAATAIGAIGFLLLCTMGVSVATDTVPGAWGFDTRDAVLHAVLMVANLILLVWLFPDGLQDPAWRPRRRGPGPERK